MKSYKRKHHQRIQQALQHFDTEYFKTHNISFGGGTRIAMEIDEYRESVDIDIICPTIASYRAARSEISTQSLGTLVTKEFNYLREIKADRYAARTFINIDNKPIKLEIISFADYRLKSIVNPDLFPIPYLDTSSCYITKLLANADRALQAPFKDIIDIIVLFLTWGKIPEKAWKEAKRHYGDAPEQQLIKSLKYLLQNKKEHIENAKNMGMNASWIEKVIDQGAEALLANVSE